MLEKPRFLQGLYPFEGAGLDKPRALSPAVRYVTPADKRAQFVYLRAGNAAPEMIYLLMKRDGKPMRYFPVAAKGAIHVPLSVVEDLLPDTALELEVAAPAGVKSAVVIDIGLVEI